MEQCRAAFPAKGRPADTNLTLSHVTRKRVITIAQRRKLRRDKPAAYLTLEGLPPLGQKLYVYPTVPLICVLQTARQLCNSQFLSCWTLSATMRESHIVAQDRESGHAYTIASCQGRQYRGTVALWDTRARHWTKRHVYTALSRARSWV